MWELHRAVTQSDELSPDEKALLQKLAWNREAWESGLIQNLGQIPDSHGRFKLGIWWNLPSRMRWSGTIEDVDSSVYRIFLFQQPAHSNPPRHWPLTCIVTDDEYGLQVWKVIAHGCYRFESASVEPTLPPVLETTCWGWPLGSMGSYRYQVSAESIDQLGEPTWEMGGFRIGDLDAPQVDGNPETTGGPTSKSATHLQTPPPQPHEDD